MESNSNPVLTIVILILFSLATGINQDGTLSVEYTVEPEVIELCKTHRECIKDYECDLSKYYCAQGTTCGPGEFCTERSCCLCLKGHYQDENAHSNSSCKVWTEKPSGPYWVLAVEGTIVSDQIWKCDSGTTKVKTSPFEYECQLDGKSSSEATAEVDKNETDENSKPPVPYFQPPKVNDAYEQLTVTYSNSYVVVKDTNMLIEKKINKTNVVLRYKTCHLHMEHVKMVMEVNCERANMTIHYQDSNVTITYTNADVNIEYAGMKITMKDEAMVVDGSESNLYFVLFIVFLVVSAVLIFVLVVFVIKHGRRQYGIYNTLPSARNS